MKVVTVRNPVWGQVAAVEVTAVTAPTAAAAAATATAAFAVTVHQLLTVFAHLMEWVVLILLLLLKRSFKCQYRCMNTWKLAWRTILFNGEKDFD